jgi:hypothetical protein
MGAPLVRERTGPDVGLAVIVVRVGNLTQEPRESRDLADLLAADRVHRIR